MRDRARRTVLVVAVAYLAVTVIFHGGVGAAVVIARLQGRAPSPPAPLDIENLRQVDERVWASGQPERRHYRQLADAGVTLIVDLRTGAADDRSDVDRAALRRVRIDYLSIPVRDGHVPDEAVIRRFADLVAGSSGKVLVHCGAGVGRSSSLAAGYLAYAGQDVSLWDTLALGSVTLSQAWFLSTGERNTLIRGASEALDLPRRTWSRIRGIV